MRKKEIILSCPFCGSMTVIVCRTNEFACWIRCEDCGADAEHHKTRAGAIKKWNRRERIRGALVKEDQDKEWKEYWKQNE